MYFFTSLLLKPNPPDNSLQVVHVERLLDVRLEDAQPRAQVVERLLLLLQPLRPVALGQVADRADRVVAVLEDLRLDFPAHRVGETLRHCFGGYVLRGGKLCILVRPFVVVILRFRKSVVVVVVLAAFILGT